HDPHLRRRAGHARAPHRHLGPGHGAERRLQALPPEGDPRAAAGDHRHHARPHRAGGGRGAARRRRGPAPGGADPARGGGGVRHGVARLPGRQVPARAPGRPPLRGRLRERVPLPQPDPRPANPAGRGVAVGRDGRHAGGGRGGAREGHARPRHLQRGRLLDRAAVERRALHPRRPGDQRRQHEGVHDPADGALSSRPPPRTPAGPDRRRAGPQAPRRPRRAAPRREGHPRGRGRGRAHRPTLRQGLRLPLPRARRELPGRARGGAQAEGDLLHPRRGLPGGRDEARADRAHQRANAGGRAHPARRRLPEDPLQPEGGRVTRRAHHRGDRRALARGGGRRAHGPADERAPHADPAHHPPPAPRLPRRRLPRHRRGPAAQPGEERHRRVTAERRGVLQVAGAALLWSLGGIGIKAIAEPPLKIAAYRSATAAVVLFLFFRPKLAGRGPGFFAASACCAACLTTFVVATKWTTAANAVFLQYSGVVWVFLLAPLVVGEPRHARDALAIAVALGGMALFFGGPLEARAHAGDAVAVVSGVFYAGLVLLLRRERGASAEAAVTWGSVLAAAALAPIVLRDPGVGARSAAILVLLGTIQIAAAQALFVRGLEHVRAAQAALVSMLEPIANPLWVLLVLGEVPSVFAVVGGAVVLAAIAWR